MLALAAVVVMALVRLEIAMDVSGRVLHRAVAACCGATAMGWDGPWWVAAVVDLFVLGRALSPSGRVHGVQEFQFADL